ncbi:hypothetical protein HWV62_779 [Athelia sp. TMB]|nr:hypothetical protein HWV62_779 [Athelia sp. TMB]
MDLIRKIRRENGCDQEMLQRARSDPEILSTIKALQGNASRDELYSKSTHFLLEFIQNADDNTYAADVLPQLCLTLGPDSKGDAMIGIMCNEIGFKEENVIAICKIGASTKKNVQGYIGFKSVFRVADVVHIASGKYMFRLDRREELGMITPIWNEKSPGTILKGWTSFHLELARSENPKEMAARLVELSSSLLLFLRRLRSLSVTIKLGDRRLDRVIVIKCTHKNQLAHVEKIDNGVVSSQRFFMMKTLTPTYPDSKQRLGITKSEIILAFPINDSGEPHISPQPVHAFLPLRHYGFSFIIQADFLTSANREDVLFGLSWNVKLRQGIIKNFLSAVLKQFPSLPALQFTWIRYLPDGIRDNFFRVVEVDLVNLLKTSPIFCTADKRYKKPSQFVTVPSNFCHGDGAPLIPERYLPGDLSYLSPQYDLKSDGEYIARLGVLPMSEYAFVVSLQRMRDIITLQSETWHELVCAQLCSIHQAKDPKINLVISDLELLPLCDGTWARGDSASSIFFDSQLAGVPQDLGMKLLKSGIRPSSWRYCLFQSLGVREADSRNVATKILETHRDPALKRNVNFLIGHAVFMFVHRQSPPAGLRVMDDKCIITHSKEVYFDIAHPGQTVRMRDVLRSPARFLHPNYMEVDLKDRQDEWPKWLQEVLLVNVYPRLINSIPAREFLELPHNISAQQFLLVLRETWPHWSGNISAKGISILSKIQLTCENGTVQDLGATFLRRGPLGHYDDLPFLPAKLPSSAHWQFLRELGVVMQVDPAFFLWRLRSLKGDGKVDAGIDKIYKQLEARFDDDPDTIRMAFANEALIFCPARSEKKWFSLAETVWTGPPSMISKPVLKVAYPSLEKLFRLQLCLSSANSNILADEITLLAKKWRGKIIPVTVCDQVLSILHNIGQAITSHPLREPEWLASLVDESIFPVSVPSKGLVLCSRKDHFYVPDRSGEFRDLFGSSVPLLSPSSVTPIQHIMPVLDCLIFSSHMKYLESSVTVQSTISGDRALDCALTEKYQGRFSYIERLVHHGSPSSMQLDALDQLRSMTIYSVERIQCEFSLESFHHRKGQELVFEGDEGHMSIVRARSSSSGKCDIIICNRLADLLGVQMDNLLTLVSHSRDAVDMIMKMKGIPSLSASKLSGRRPAVSSRNSAPARTENSQQNSSILDALSAQSAFDRAREANPQQHQVSKGLTFSSVAHPVVSSSSRSLMEVGAGQKVLDKPCPVVTASEPILNTSVLTSKLELAVSNPTGNPPSSSSNQNSASIELVPSKLEAAPEVSKHDQLALKAISLKHSAKPRHAESAVPTVFGVLSFESKDASSREQVPAGVALGHRGPGEQPEQRSSIDVLEPSAKTFKAKKQNNRASTKQENSLKRAGAHAEQPQLDLNARIWKAKQDSRANTKEQYRSSEFAAKELSQSALSSAIKSFIRSDTAIDLSSNRAAACTTIQLNPPSWQLYSANFEHAILQPSVQEKVDVFLAEDSRSRESQAAAPSNTETGSTSHAIGAAGEYYVGFFINTTSN